MPVFAILMIIVGIIFINSDSIPMAAVLFAAIIGIYFIAGIVTYPYF